MPRLVPEHTPMQTFTTTYAGTLGNSSSGTPSYTYVVNPTPAARQDYVFRESWLSPSDMRTVQFNPSWFFTTDDFEQSSPEKRDKAKFNMEEVW